MEKNHGPQMFVLDKKDGKIQVRKLGVVDKKTSGDCQRCQEQRTHESEKKGSRWKDMTKDLY